MNNVSHLSTSLIGRKIRIRMDVMFNVVTFSAVVIKESENEVTVRIPPRVRELQWTEFPEAAYRFPRASAERALVNS